MNNINHSFTIKDLENISGIKAHTIRIWEKRYNILTPERTETNIRLYTTENLQKLLNVTLLNNNGVKISKIAEMSDSEVVLLARELAVTSDFQEDFLNSFKLSMFKFDSVLFDNTYAKLIQKQPFREVFKNIFIPLVKSIGMLWQTQSITSAHEHFITNLIVQKIHLNTEKLNFESFNENKLFVLFLPENEIHDLGLLYLNYELLLRGYKTIYLGKNIPIKNLRPFSTTNSSVHFVTNLTVQPYEDELKDFLTSLKVFTKDITCQFSVIGRRSLSFENEVVNSGVNLYSSIFTFLETF